MREVADAAAVGEDELLALHEHAARAAAGVVDAALVRLDHLDQQLDDGLRRVELAAALAFGAGELAEEVFVDAAEHVLAAALGVAEADRADQVDQFAEPLLVERRPGVVLGEHALERRVVLLDRDHRVVDQLADRRLLGVRLEVRPAGLLRHPEDVLGRVLVAVLGVGVLVGRELRRGVPGRRRRCT